MSCTIWTPPALASEARSLQLALWRAVEAQHTVATRVLVDSQAEQALLDRALPVHRRVLHRRLKGGVQDFRRSYLLEQILD